MLGIHLSDNFIPRIRITFFQKYDEDEDEDDSGES
jgi:hypothetical protein